MNGDTKRAVLDGNRLSHYLVRRRRNDGDGIVHPIGDVQVSAIWMDGNTERSPTNLDATILDCVCGCIND